MKAFIRTSIAFAVVLGVLVAGTAWADDLTIGNYTLVNSKRVGRVEYEYTYKADLTNSCGDVKNVIAQVTSNSPHTTVLEGFLEFGDILEGATATSSDTFIIKHNRRYPLDWSQLIWDVNHGEAVGVVGPAGGVVKVDDPDSALYGTKADIPAGALSDNIYLTMKMSTPDHELPEETLLAGFTIDFGPDRVVFAEKITITMPYNDSDNDGYIDGTNVPEEYVCGLAYDREMSRWLYLRKLSQDTISNTVTFEDRHFSKKIVAALNPNKFGRDDVYFFTIDGCQLTKISPDFFPGVLGPNDDFRPAYLKPALIYGFKLGLTDTDVYSYGGESGESWHGDPNNTEKIVPDLIKVMVSEFYKAKVFPENKKFILMTHSWGTVLAFLALEYSEVEPDLFITLSCPLGSQNYPDPGISMDTILNYILNPLWWELWPIELIIANPNSFVTLYVHEQIQDTENILNDILNETLNNDLLSLISRELFKKRVYPEIVQKHDPYFVKWINYYANGDIFSGPSEPSKVIPWDISISPGYNDFEDKIVDSELERSIDSTSLYHAITSLDARGVANEYVDPDHPEFDGKWQKHVESKAKLDLAKYFRARVRCDIISEIGDGSFCSKFDTNFNGSIDISELLFANGLWKSGEIPIGELLEAIEIWKWGTGGSPDSDDDGFPDELDNCPSDYNPGQEDSDGDEIGDACDCNLDFDCSGCIQADELYIATQMWKNGEILVGELLTAFFDWQACGNNEDLIPGEYNESLDYGCDGVDDETNILIFHDDHTFESIPRCNGYEGTWEYFPEEDKIRFTFNGCDYPVYEGGAGATISGLTGFHYDMIGEIEEDNFCWRARRIIAEP